MIKNLTMRGNKYGLCVSGCNNSKVTKIFRLLLYKINNCIKYAIILFVQYSEVLWLTRQLFVNNTNILAKSSSTIFFITAHS